MEQPSSTTTTTTTGLASAPLYAGRLPPLPPLVIRSGGGGGRVEPPPAPSSSIRLPVLANVQTLGGLESGEEVRARPPQPPRLPVLRLGMSLEEEAAYHTSFGDEEALARLAPRFEAGHAAEVRLARARSGGRGEGGEPEPEEEEEEVARNVAAARAALTRPPSARTAADLARLRRMGVEREAEFIERAEAPRIARFSATQRRLESEAEMNARMTREAREARERQEREAEEIRSAAARRHAAAVGTLETDGGGLRLAELPPRIPAARPFGEGRRRERSPPPAPAEAREALRVIREGAAARARGEPPREEMLRLAQQALRERREEARLTAGMDRGGIVSEGGATEIPRVISVRGKRGAAPKMPTKKGKGSGMGGGMGGAGGGRGGRRGAAGGGGGGVPPSGVKGGLKTFNVGGSICVPRTSKKGNKIACVVYNNEFGCQKV